MFYSAHILTAIILVMTTVGCGDGSGTDGRSSSPAGSSTDPASGPDAGRAPHSDVRELTTRGAETREDSDVSSVPSTTASSDAASTAEAVASAPVKSTEDAPPASVDERAEYPDATELPDDLLNKEALTSLNPDGTVLLDLAGKRVFVESRVCFTQGVLEMLLCLTQTKEHESILVFDGKAQTIHAGLLALGLKEGTPARYDPDSGAYSPASGAVLDIFLHWTDRQGKLHRRPAQEWCRRSRFRYFEERFDELPADLILNPDGNLRYDKLNKMLFWYGPMSEAQRDACLELSSDDRFQKAIRRFHEETQPRQLTADWIFVGSGFVNDPETGEHYLAEGGYVICVANFAAAMIDLSIESSPSGNENLTYEAWTERIPPRGSEVLVEIVPRRKSQPEGGTLQQ